MIQFIAVLGVIPVAALLGRRFRRLDVPIARLLLFVFVPLVIVHAIATWQGSVAKILGFAVALSTVMGVVGLMLPLRVRPSLRFAAFAYYNIGWLGIPLAHLLLGPPAVPVMASAYMGGLLFGNSVCLGALAGEGVIGGMRRVLALPPLYAFVLGLVDRQFGMLPWEAFEPVIVAAREAMSMLGMALIGIGLARVPHAGWRDAVMFSVSRLAASVVVGIGALWLLQGVFSPVEWQALVLLCLLPVAANVVALSRALGHDLAAPAALVGASTLVSGAGIAAWAFVTAI